MNGDNSPAKPAVFFERVLALRQKVTRRALGAAAGVALLLLAGGAWVAQGAGEAGDAQESGPAPRLPVLVTAPLPADEFAQRRSYTGTLLARRAADLGFQRLGRIERILVEEGAAVSQGQLLAALDTAQLAAQREELVQRLAAAQAQLDELQAGPRSEVIEAARAQAADLRAQWELAQASHLRRSKLAATRAVAEERVEQSQFGLKSAAARLRAAEQQLAELEAGTRPEQIRAQQGGVKQLEAQLRANTVALRDSEIRAPFAGTITRRLLDEGTTLGAAVPVLKLVEDAVLEARIGIPARVAAQLRPGDAHQLQVADQTVSAVVRTLLPELDPATRTQPVVLDIDPASRARQHLVPGQIVRLEVQEATRSRGFWVPLASLGRSDRGLWAVLVAEPEPEQARDAAEAASPRHAVVRRRDVEILHTDGQQVLVRGGLRPSDAVIVSGAHRVVAGQPVTITRQAGPSGPPTGERTDG